ASETNPYAYLVKPFSDGQLCSAIEIALHHHQTDVQLRKRERWISTTLRAIGDGVIAADPEGRVTFLNPAAESLTGVSPEDAIGRTIVDVLHVVDRTGSEIPSVAQEAMEHGTVAHLPADSVLIA